MPKIIVSEKIIITVRIKLNEKDSMRLFFESSKAIIAIEKPTSHTMILSD
jgi:hypothetical protein